MDQQIYVADMPVSGIHADKKRKSAFQEFWRRFRKNRLAVAGLAVVVLYILMAIFADLFFSLQFHHPEPDIQRLRKTADERRDR